MNTIGWIINVSYVFGSILLTLAVSMFSATNEHTFNIPAAFLTLAIMSIIYSFIWGINGSDFRSEVD